MLDYNYGNLHYAFFRRSVLSENGTSFFSFLIPTSLNEIPLLLFVSAKGQWRVLPDVGIYKRTNDLTYAQAKWEMEGGRLPNSGGVHYYYKCIPSIFRYHKLALKDIGLAINLLNIDGQSKRIVYQRARKNILKHFSFFVFRYKPPRK